MTFLTYLENKNTCIIIILYPHVMLIYQIIFKHQPIKRLFFILYKCLVYEWSLDM